MSAQQCKRVNKGAHNSLVCVACWYEMLFHARRLMNMQTNYLLGISNDMLTVSDGSDFAATAKRRIARFRKS